MATVVIDAGHGGHDSGAANGTRLEKNDNLRMALAVGNILRNCGIRVIQTRDRDVFVPLGERANISNRNNADLFVSVHRNSFTSPQANGVENWVFTNPSAAAVRAATLVLNNVVAAGVQSNRGVKRGNFQVLRETRAPAMLMEYGFISNAEDNRLFDTRFNQYAQATANGVLQFLGRTCGTTGGGGGTTNPRRELIRDYQRTLNRMFNAGLVEDGIWGPRTRAATRLVRQGDRGDLVRILQRGLNNFGFGLNVDGIFGPITNAAVRAFQARQGLGVDGIAGPNTFERLFTT